MGKLFVNEYEDEIKSKLDQYIKKGKDIRCPDFELLEEFYHGKLNFYDFCQVLEHIGECGICTENVSVIKAEQGIIKEGKMLKYTKPEKLFHQD